MAYEYSIMAKKGIAMLQNRLLYWLDRLYNILVKIGFNLQSLFLLYMRLTWGHQFILVGLEKLRNVSETATFFDSLGIPYSHFHVYEVGLFELVGGVLLVFGLASRLAAIPLIVIMIAALMTAHATPIANWQFILDPRSLAGQNPYPFLITALMVFCFGPGRISLDAWLKRWVSHQPKY